MTGDTSILDQFIRLCSSFEHSDMLVRNRAASEAYDLASGLTLEQAIELAHSNNYGVRIGAGIGLRRKIVSLQKPADNPVLVMALKRLLNSKRSRVRYRAIETIESHPGLVTHFRQELESIQASERNEYCLRKLNEALSQTKPETARLENRLSVFVSYSHRDAEICRELRKHLSNLARDEDFDIWLDHELTAGQVWREEINQRIDGADIILLLVSADYFESEACRDWESPRALERLQAGAARVVPVLLRPIERLPSNLAELEALPSKGLAVTSWPDQEAALVDITRGVRRVVEQIRAGTRN